MCNPIKGLALKIRTDTNNGTNFSKFILDSVINDYLVPNSILVADNAKIHTSDVSMDTFDFLSANINLTTRFLCPYSPETNPTELIFKKFKCILKKKLLTHHNLFLERSIIESFKEITLNDIYKFFEYCIHCKFAKNN